VTSFQFDLTIPMEDDFEDPTVELRPIMSGGGLEGFGRSELLMKFFIDQF
jgi:hypothetical protein